MRECPYLTEAISHILENFRKNRRMTKTSLADFSGLDRRYLLKIAQGSKKPTVNAIYCICEALNISPVDFFTKVDAERLRLVNANAKIDKNAFSVNDK